MALSTIYSTSLLDYRPVIWYGKPVYRHSSQLKSFLTTNLGDEYGNLFTEPYISDAAVKGDSKAHWVSEYISTDSVPITQLPANKQKQIKDRLSLMLNKIEALSGVLIKSGEKDKIKWGEILQTVIEIPSLEHIYVENDKISLVCWGFYSDKTEIEKFRLRKSLIVDVPKIKEDKIQESIIEETNIETTVVDDELQDINVKETDKSTEKTELNKEKKKPNFIKKHWWLFVILGILLIFFLIFLLSNRKENENLPVNEGEIPPIDTTKIIKNPDGKSVISNQLNLWLTNDSIPIENFADDFKTQYPNNNYKIVYFNKTLKRVRIEFPEEEKENLKENLKKQFPEYNLIVFEEEIMRQNYIPPDPGFSDSKKSWGYEIIKAYDAWNINKGKSEIIVAIIDDGFDLNHPELTGKILNPYNVPLNNTNPNTGNINMSHGTHVAGTAIGNMSNSTGVAGIAPNCSFMPVQVGDPFGNMSTTAIIDAILYCISNNANVINMSLGTPAPPGLSNTDQSTQKELIENTYKEEEKLWNELFTIADKKNVTIVLAGGNDNVLIGIGPMGRTPFTVNVSAIDSNMKKANFSNYGDFSTVSAPGVQIFSSIPNNKFAFYDGTSMAAPIVTGAIALLKSEKPALTTSEIKEILKKTGIKINDSDGYVGELIQLSKAIKYVKGETDDTDCSTEIKAKIDSLRREIDKLLQLCDSTSNNDESELVIPDNPKDFEFAKGRWKSSSDLHNLLTKESIELFFDFEKDGTGKLTMREADGNLCYASLTLSTDKKILNIVQDESAKCIDGLNYEIYEFQCVQTGKGAAQCRAETSANKKVIDFTLKRVY